MTLSLRDSFKTIKKINVNGNTFSFFSLKMLDDKGITNLASLPFSIRILLENMLRNEDGKLVLADDVLKVAAYNSREIHSKEIPFMPARVVLQDFTGVPAIVDLASMREAIKKLGGDPDRINPIVRSDLVIDHSVQVDMFGNRQAFQFNVDKEYQRNQERYAFLKWAQKSFHNFHVVPPGTGIIHQVNLEYLAQVIISSPNNGQIFAYPDTLVGTDSHTTMINGLSVLGWGVGGIEAEAVMLGQPYYMVLPEVVGVKLTGILLEGVTATDLVLSLTQILRNHGVVGKFVEYFGKGLSNLSLPDRATIANMSPEYGATMGFFPIDDTLITYLKQTARKSDLISLVETYAKEQALYRTDDTPDPQFHKVLELDMSTVEPGLAGPKRPQDRIALKNMKKSFSEALLNVFKKSSSSFNSENPQPNHKFSTENNMKSSETEFNLSHGSIVLAAITSCTNTSNPSVMITAGLLAKNAFKKGLLSKPWVKTSLAPGSRVVTEYLTKSGLLRYLEAQKFYLVGYGCTTCIGNSGPLPAEIEHAIKEGDLVVAAVLSGNRNFEGRIHSSIRANYLASPPLVVAYALAGRVDIDFTEESIGNDENGNPLYLKDIWPSHEEIIKAMENALNAKMYEEKYSQVFTGDEHWQSLKVEGGKLFNWEKSSTYIKMPPFFDNISLEKTALSDIKNARVIALLGDSVTTDHISPAGTIHSDSPAGKYLLSKGVAITDFNSFGSRRGNHEVMIRGTFGNIRIKNRLLSNVEGGYTKYFPTGEMMSIYDAAMVYQREKIPLIVIAGKEYGTGSSRDWAAKGTYLLGIKAVLAESFERIHRSNLVGMGVLPLQFQSGDNQLSLGLTGEEIFHIIGIEEGLQPGKELKVIAINQENTQITFNVIARLDTPIEVDYYEHEGILRTVLWQMITKKV